MDGTQLRSIAPLTADVKKELVVLRRANTPMVLCDLLAIGETGCRCMAHVRVNEWCSPEKWQALFRAGEVFQAEISWEPFIPFLSVTVEVLSIQVASGSDLELCFSFVGMDADQTETLTRALLEIDAILLQLSTTSTKTDTQPQPTTDGSVESATPKLGEILCQTNVLTPDQLATSIFNARPSGLRLGGYLVREGVLTPLQLLEALSAQTGLAYADFDVNAIPAELRNLIQFEQLKLFKCVPIARDGETVRLACADLLSKVELDALERVCGMRVELVLCREDLPDRFLDAVAASLDQQRRKHKRFEVSMPAAFQCYSAEGPLLFEGALEGQVIDVSEGGMQVAGPIPVKLEEGPIAEARLKLIVAVGAKQKEVIALCDVRHIRFTPNTTGELTGVYGLKVDSVINEHSGLTQIIRKRTESSRPDESGGLTGISEA